VVLDRKAALQLVKKVLAADCACEEESFDEEGTFVYQAREVEGARRFPLPEKFLGVVTMGTGVVVSCSLDRLKWAEANLRQLSRDALFSSSTISSMERYVASDSQVMAGPELKHICTRDSFQPYITTADIKIILAEGEGIQRLYDNNKFPNALGYSHNPQRPRFIAYLAKHDDELIGVAAASVDCESMWQVGVDVIEGCRSYGIGKAIVSRLTEALHNMGKLPYYSTNISNIASRRLATSIGYWPTWVELYSKEKQ
jgi:hypothetical protein